uniref:HlyD family secretion protein n=1 Tax=Dialister succinatiphilus TaxID=487173 RepID=UPI004038D391
MQLSWLHSKKTKIIIWTVILVFLLCGIYAYTHRSRVSVGKTSAHPLVKVEKMEKKDMMKRVVLSGETVPWESVDISPKYAGRLEKVYVDLGDKVTKGDILVSQDTKDISFSIAQNRAGSQEAAADAVESRASYDAGTLKAQSDYDNALSTFNRYDTLFQEGAVSRQERDDKYQAMMEARAALQNLTGQDVDGVPAVIASKEAAAEKAAYTVDSLESQKGDMTMYAPVSGTIGYREAEAGEWAAAGQKL